VNVLATASRRLQGHNPCEKSAQAHALGFERGVRGVHSIVAGVVAIQWKGAQAVVHGFLEDRASQHCCHKPES